MLLRIHHQQTIGPEQQTPRTQQAVKRLAQAKPWNGRAGLLAKAGGLVRLLCLQRALVDNWAPNPLTYNKLPTNLQAKACKPKAFIVNSEDPALTAQGVAPDWKVGRRLGLF